MKTKITKLSAWLALFVASGYVVCPAYVRAELGTTASPASARLGTGPIMVPLGDPLATAAATTVNGHVMKTLLSGQNKLSLPTPCHVGDVLPDGSVVQTGKETSSFAQLSWASGKVTRIWRDSTVRIFAGRSSKIDTVCINKGSLIFKKDKADQSYYYVESKLLQARIHGTTVRFHSDPPVDGKDGLDSILVMEGTAPVRVKNKETGSVIELPVGIELQVKVRASYKCNDSRFNIPELPDGQDQLPPRSSATQTNNIASLDEPDFRLNPNKGELLLDDKTSSVVAYTANSRAILEDPMVKGSANVTPIDSLDLIETAMKGVPSSDKPWNNAVDEIFNFGHPDKLISNLKITHVPNSMYTVGHNVGTQSEFKPITLPATDHSPASRMPYNRSNIASANLRSPVTAVGVIPMTGASAEDPTAAELDALAAPDRMALKHEDQVVDSEAN